MTSELHGSRRAILAIGLVALLAGCGPGSPRLVMPGYGIGSSDWHWGPGDPYTMSREFVLCLDMPGSVQIKDISLQYVENDLRVDGFALTPRSALHDLSAGDDLSTSMTLAEAGYRGPAVTTQVEAVCYDDGGDWQEWRELDDFTHLGIQFSKPHDETAGASGLVITYESGSRERTIEWDLQVILCGEADSPAYPGAGYADACDLHRIEVASRDG